MFGITFSVLLVRFVGLPDLRLFILGFVVVVFAGCCFCVCFVLFDLTLFVAWFDDVVLGRQVVVLFCLIAFDCYSCLWATCCYLLVLWFEFDLVGCIY